MPKYFVHSVDARHFRAEGYYLFQASLQDRPRLVVTLRVGESPGKEIMNELIEQGGPVSIDLEKPDIVGAHIVPGYVTSSHGPAPAV